MRAGNRLMLLAICETKILAKWLDQISSLRCVRPYFNNNNVKLINEQDLEQLFVATNLNVVAENERFITHAQLHTAWLNASIERNDLSVNSAIHPLVSAVKATSLDTHHTRKHLQSLRTKLRDLDAIGRLAFGHFGPFSCAITKSRCKQN